MFIGPSFDSADARDLENWLAWLHASCCHLCKSESTKELKAALVLGLTKTPTHEMCRSSQEEVEPEVIQTPAKTSPTETSARRRHVRIEDEESPPHTSAKRKLSLDCVSTLTCNMRNMLGTQGSFKGQSARD